jgi:hypothetical protein
LFTWLLVDSLVPNVEHYNRSNVEWQPNAWRISRAVVIDGADRWAEISVQNAIDLARRHGVGLHALVGRHHARGPR